MLSKTVVTRRRPAQRASATIAASQTSPSTGLVPAILMAWSIRRPYVTTTDGAIPSSRAGAMIRARKRTAAWTKLNSSAAESTMPRKPPFLGLMRLSSSSPLRKSQMRRKVTYHPSLALSALARGDLAFFADYFQQRGQRGEHYRPSDDSDGAEGFQPSQQGKQNEQGIDVGAAA